MHPNPPFLTHYMLTFYFTFLSLPSSLFLVINLLYNNSFSMSLPSVSVSLCLTSTNNKFIGKVPELNLPMALDLASHDQHVIVYARPTT